MCALHNECGGAKSQREKRRNFFLSSLPPSLPLSLVALAAFANSACFTCDAENLAGEGERGWRRESPKCECRFSFSPSCIPVHPTDCSIFLPLGVQTDREEREREKERERRTSEWGN